MDEVTARRRLGRIAAVCAVVAVLVAGCTSGDGSSGGASGADGGGSDGEQAAMVRLSAESVHLLRVLQQERISTVLDLVGLQDTLADIATLSFTRRETERAINGFNAAVADGEGAGALYEGAVDALEELDVLRADVDGRGQPRTLDELPFATEIFDRYSDVVESLLDADAGAAADLAVSIDDPVVRRGAELADIAQGQLEVTSQLQFRILGSLGDYGDPEWIREVASLQATSTRGRESVIELADGTAYQDAAEQLETDLDAAGMAEAVDQLLRTGQGDFAEIIGSLSLPPDQGWPAFLDLVADIMAAAG